MMSRSKEKHSLMLNVVVEKGESKTHDPSGSNITQPRMRDNMQFLFVILGLLIKSKA